MTALSLPRGEIILPHPDGRILRPILGYDIRRAPGLDHLTRHHILDCGGWQHIFSGLRVAATVDNTPDWGPLLHVSLSYHDHDPPWDDIKAVRAAFYPATVDVMMMLPRAEDYVNLHPHCFHLWQTPQPWRLR
jgi:hypothetical protein